MLIHELLQHPKKVNEGLGEFFGLNNPRVAQAMGQLGGELVASLAARFTTDPRYTKLPLAQRKRAIERDEYLQRTAEQSVESWNKQLGEIEIRNGAELTDQQYQAALTNWANKGLYNNKFNNLDSNMKAKALAHFAEVTRNRKNPEEIKRLIGSLIADEAAREVEVATRMATASAPVPPGSTAAPTALAANVTGATKPGAPNAAEMQKFDQLVAAAAKAQT